MVAIIFGIALTVLDATILNLALPDITRHFGASPAASVWVINAYQLATLGLLLPCAYLGDAIGYRRVYLIGLVVFTTASVGCILAPTLGALTAARAVQGLGAAGMMAVNSALVRLTYPSRALGRAIALNSVTVATASVAGPSIAAVVLSVASWPWLFALQLPLGPLLLAIGSKALPFNLVANSAPKLQWRDVLMNAAMFSLVFLGADALGVRRGESPEPRTLAIAAGLLAAGFVIGTVYLRRQARQPTPLFPVDLLRIRIFALSMCTSVSSFAAQTLAFIALPFLLLEGQGRSHFEAGLVLTAWPAGIVVTAPIAGRLVGRLGGGLLGGIGLAVFAVGLAWLALLPDAPASWQVAAGCAVCGLGFGLFQSPNNHTIVTSAPMQRAGAASGMLGTARLTGQSLGAVVLGLIFGAMGVNGGITFALALASLLAAVASVFSLLRMRR